MLHHTYVISVGRQATHYSVIHVYKGSFYTEALYDGSSVILLLYASVYLPFCSLKPHTVHYYKATYAKKVTSYKGAAGRVTISESKKPPSPLANDPYALTIIWQSFIFNGNLVWFPI